MFSWLKNVSEETGTFLRGDAVVWIGAAVKSPTSSIAALSLQNKLFVEREVVTTREHFLFLSMLSASGCKIGECQLCSDLRVRMRAF
jgi:hypothetical protein